MSDRTTTTEGALARGQAPVQGHPAPALAPKTPSGIYTPPALLGIPSPPMPTGASSPR